MHLKSETIKQAHPKRPKKRQLSSAQLLALAAKNRPPQRWYDEKVDPTKPTRRSVKRGK